MGCCNCCCCATPDAAKTNEILPKLEGKWHIQQTTFPMWLNGNNLSPTLNYTIEQKNGYDVLFDQVKYIDKNTKNLKIIEGYDYTNPNDCYSFIWQGKGILSMVGTSQWKLVIFNEELQYGVIWFAKTLFTPEGVDIITTAKRSNIELLSRIKDEMEEFELLKPFIHDLKNIDQHG